MGSLAQDTPRSKTTRTSDSFLMAACSQAQGDNFPGILPPILMCVCLGRACQYLHDHILRLLTVGLLCPMCVSIFNMYNIVNISKKMSICNILTIIIIISDWQSACFARWSWDASPLTPKPAHFSWPAVQNISIITHDQRAVYTSSRPTSWRASLRHHTSHFVKWENSLSSYQMVDTRRTLFMCGSLKIR